MGRTAIVCAVLCCLFANVKSECLDSEGNRRSDGAGPYIGADGCNTCFCSNGTSVCTRMLCRPGHRRCMGTDGRIHSQGDSFKSSDGCNTCTCTEHGVACTEMACFNGCVDTATGKTHQVGQSFPAADGCNTCVCETGNRVACTEMFCLDG